MEREGIEYYSEGYGEGREEGYDFGYEAGRDSGYSLGYGEGFIEGIRAADFQYVEEKPSYFDMVKFFHRAMGLPENEWTGENEVLRYRLLKEEYEEYLQAFGSGNEVDLLDAICDMIYILCGTAVVMGADLDGAFSEVHRSNMSKWPPTYREDGKLLKGESFSPPALEPFLNNDLSYTPVVATTNLSGTVPTGDELNIS